MRQAIADRVMVAGLALIAGVAVAGTARAQPAPAPPPPPPPPTPTMTAPDVIEAGEPLVNLTPPVVPPEVQIVRFHAPEGVTVEVLGPPPEPVSLTLDADDEEALTVGLRVGVGYRLRLSNLPARPDAELFPVVEIVGHLHRPSDVDPSRFPIRVVFSFDDIEDVVDHSRLVTQVVYLEDPDQALPLSLPKDEIPIVTLSPVEEPVQVAAALGRVMAIVRLGARHPSVEEWAGDLATSLLPGACPFSGPAGGRCHLPLGPARGVAPPPGRPWLPRDEYLCDGGDFGEPAHFGGDGALGGVDPRDAVILFHDSRRPRILPTNLVCVYAPRFAAVRTSIGANEAVTVEVPRGAETLAQQVTHAISQEAARMVQNQAAEIARQRSRASAMRGRVFAGGFSEVRVLDGFDAVTILAAVELLQAAETTRNREKAAGLEGRHGAVAIKTAESAVVTGIIESANEMVMFWKPQELAAVETPPDQPGLAVIKRVSHDVAEPGTTVTFAIQYRNMGNVPIHSVSIIDSLLPRLAYLPGTAMGPEGAVFTAAENRAGSTELRWDLPGPLEPGAEGYVSFQALVR